MVYLADSIMVDLFHPGVERTGFMIPGGGINKPLENKELTPFITPSSQRSEAPFLFQAVPHPPVPIFCTSTDHPTARPHITRSYQTGPPSRAVAPTPASAQQALSFSRQYAQRIQVGDAQVSPATRQGGHPATSQPRSCELAVPRVTIHLQEACYE
jgi:hypothetical protein